MGKRKGSSGYIHAKKWRVSIIVLIGAALVAAILFAGYLKHGSKMNYYTIFAILLALPVCKFVVDLIMLIPQHSIDEAKQMKVEGASANLTVLFDLIITTEKSAVNLPALVIQNRTVCGFARCSKKKAEYLSGYIKETLEYSGCGKCNVKIVNDFKGFISRAEGMDSIASVEVEDYRQQEKDIRKVILDISM